MQLHHLRHNISPVGLVFWGKTFELLQPEHWILEHWTIQNPFGRLIKESTNFKMFNIQITKDNFSKMLRAWIVQYFLERVVILIQAWLDQWADDFSILVERIVNTYMNFDVKNCGHKNCQT